MSGERADEFGEDLECVSREVASRDFPVLRRLIDGDPVIYLDNAATSLKPTSVIEATTHYYAEISANIHRGKHYLSEEASALYEDSRHKVAQFINANGNEVVFVKNTTEALNMVAAGLGLDKTDQVITAVDAHHSQLLPWMRVAKTHPVRVDDDGRIDLHHFRDLLAKQPKVVAISHCSNVSGVYAPLDVLVAEAKRANAIVVVDAAQSIPHRKLDVTALDCDFLAFSGHKMLGPTGVGILYGKGEHLEALEPLCLGGGTVDWVTTASYTPRKIPHRLEAGTPHIAGAIGLAAAIDYLESIGLDRIEAHDEALAEVMLKEAGQRDYLKVVGGTDPHERSAIVSLALHGEKDLKDIARILSDSYGVMCRTGHMCAQPLVDHFADGQVLRASAYFYNNRSDALSFFSALDEICD